MTENDSNSASPRVSIIIPSWDGHRGGCVPRLIDSINMQSFNDFELHVIKGVSPQGRAINQGAGQARGEILVIVDDDSRLADESVLQRLVETLDADASIAMAGASIVLPPEANLFQRRAALQFPRFNTPEVDRITDSDYACHGCCAIPKGIFDAAGREREDILRGLDPDLRARFRAAGYRVVLAPHARIYHPLPESFARLVRMFFRNGFGSAYAQKFEPNSVFETDEQVDSTTFREKRSFIYRLCRFPLRLLRALSEGKELRFLAYSVYAAGYLWGILTARQIEAQAPKSNLP